MNCMFTRGARALVTRNCHRMVLCSHLRQLTRNYGHIYPFLLIRRHFQTASVVESSGWQTAIASEASCVHFSFRLKKKGNTGVGTDKKGVFTLPPSEYCTRAPCAGTRCEHSQVFSGFTVGAQARHLSTVLIHNIQLRSRLEISMIRTPFQSFRPEMLSVTQYIEVHFLEYSLVQLLLEADIILNLISLVIMSRRRQVISSKTGQI